jgi:hypothetical protein
VLAKDSSGVIMHSQQSLIKETYGARNRFLSTGPPVSQFALGLDWGGQTTPTKTQLVSSPKSRERAEAISILGTSVQFLCVDTNEKGRHDLQLETTFSSSQFDKCAEGQGKKCIGRSEFWSEACMENGQCRLVLLFQPAAYPA